MCWYSIIRFSKGSGLSRYISLLRKEFKYYLIIMVVSFFMYISIVIEFYSEDILLVPLFTE